MSFFHLSLFNWPTFSLFCFLDIIQNWMKFERISGGRMLKFDDPDLISVFGGLEGISWRKVTVVFLDGKTED